MLTQLRRLANDLAQEDIRRVARWLALNPGQVPPADICNQYRAAERILDAIDAYERLLQEQDPEAPDFTNWTEADLAAAWGR